VDFPKLKQMMQDAGSTVSGWKDSMDQTADDARQSAALTGAKFGKDKNYKPTQDEINDQLAMMNDAESMGTGAMGSVKMIGAGENAAQMLMRKAAEEASGVKIAGGGKSAAQMIKESQAAKAAANPPVAKKTAAELYRDAKATGDASVLQLEKARANAANPVKAPMNIDKLEQEAGSLQNYERLQKLLRGE